MITILFGAGAEVSYNISSGPLFVEPLLKNKYKKQITEFLGNCTVSNSKLLSPQSRKIYINTLFEEENINEIFKDNKFLKESFNDDISNVINRYVAKNLKKEELDVIDFMCKDWYKRINDYNENDKEANFFLTKARFFEALDEKFNALRLIKNNNNSLRVINTYYNTFFCILEKLGYSDNGNFDSVMKFLNQEHDYGDNDSYYKRLKDINSDEIYIATTNYTSICQSILNKDESDIAYIHGNLRWFEDKQLLTTYKAKNVEYIANNLDNILPLMFIPSGVKPVVNRLQLDQYNKFSYMLDESNTLCIVGYNFNNDDNHVNALIVSFLEGGGRMVVFDYNGNIARDINKKKWIERFMSKIEIIQIDETNSYDAFSDKIDELINRTK